jgi:hypothetical protein
MVQLMACSSPSAPLPTDPGVTITGTVLERVDGSPYSFLRIDTEKGQMWVAVPLAEIARGEKVSVKKGAVVKNFESRQAGRKFDAVVFGVIERG